MRDVLPLLTAGVGVCFLGLELVTTGLQESTSRTLRAVIRRVGERGRGEVDY